MPQAILNASVSEGGSKTALQVNSARVIKAAPGNLARIIVQAPGSAGNLTINDCATVGAAAAANQVITIAFGSLTIGQQIWLDMPMATGITVSAIPTAGVISISYN
jgi:hypothetical protein